MTTFSKKLRQIRQIRKLSQADLARKIGLHINMVSHYETGARDPSLPNLYKLCEALKVTPNQLLVENATESIYDQLTMEEIEFISLVREAVIKKHKADIKKLHKRDKEDL